MLGAQSCTRTVTGVGAVTDQTNANRSISNLFRCPSTSSSHLSFQSGFRTKYSLRSKSIFISCKSSGGSFSGRSSNADDSDGDYLEAFLLVSETIRHYQMRRQGFKEEIKWKSSGHLLPFSVQEKGSRADFNTLGQGFLERFQSPTVFLKISCDGDFLLPIIVGEFAIEKLIDALREDENGDCPNQFQFVRNLVGKLGYKVKMVRITERVINTYFARIYFSKPGEKDTLSVDARPSDAINVAKRCKAPIYVSKQIVLTDAIRIVYSMGRLRDTKSIYDVNLDSPADGPDLLAEELDLVRNMKLAIREERYTDAAMWRDKLMKLRKSRRNH
ncbi:hypothetical protein L1049_024413 [Liquidambar formosana]|uniref:BFN domain-containing protein n=1 Tax=Liquidambar formosana TaxID=63359 RepID=A0AAP0RUU4_LIQFO